MAVLYLTEQGSVLHKEGEVLVVRRGEEILARVPAHGVEQVVVFGAVGLTTQALVYLLSQGIDCVFCSSRGRYHGRLVSSLSPHGPLRLRQAQAVTREEVRVEVARGFIEGKVTNQRTLLMRFGRLRGVRLEGAVEALSRYLERLREASDLSEVMGLEGQASAVFYDGFRRLLKEDWGFRGRQRRPPPDPVNSLLSLGYTLLGYAMHRAVERVGLDPYLGFLHGPERSRPSLVLDLIEEFRPVVVDALVLALLNRGRFSREDFRPNPEDPRGVLLTQEGLKKFLPAFAQRLEREVYSPALGRSVPYRQALEGQARLLARYLSGQVARYRPFTVR